MGKAIPTPIKKLKFGDAHLDWYPQSIGGLYYDTKFTIGLYDKLIKPNLHISRIEDIRNDVFSLVENLIKTGKIKTMHQYTSLIVALRTTEIDTTDKDDNGFFKIYRIETYNPDFEDITYNNVAFHVNKHSTQLYHYCFVRVRYINQYGYDCHKNMSYSDGEWKDNNEYFLDKFDHKAKSTKQKYRSGK